MKIKWWHVALAVGGVAYYYKSTHVPVHPSIKQSEVLQMQADALRSSGDPAAGTFAGMAASARAGGL